ncbi:MAG: hypothetical protein U0525_05130 [Patescibacteria group bacterium]
MTDKIEINCSVRQIGCSNPRHPWRDTCTRLGRNYYLNAPSHQSAKDVVCGLAGKCEKCGHSPRTEDLVVSPFSETEMMPTSVTIYQNENSRTS